VSATALRREFVTSTSEQGVVRPLALGRRGAVSAGHYIAASAGEKVFDLGGNAIDAGVAASTCPNVLLFHRSDERILWGSNYPVSGDVDAVRADLELLTLWFAAVPRVRS
jgi:hypothetical protein